VCWGDGTPAERGQTIGHGSSTPDVVPIWSACPATEPVHRLKAPTCYSRSCWQRPSYQCVTNCVTTGSDERGQPRTFVDGTTAVTCNSSEIEQVTDFAHNEQVVGSIPTGGSRVDQPK